MEGGVDPLVFSLHAQRAQRPAVLRNRDWWQRHAARKAGEEYLLQRRLLRKLSTGAMVGPWVETWAYPFRWQYSALTAVDYFLAAARHDGIPPDPRLAEAIGIIRTARRPDGTWVQGHRYPGRVWFEVDVAPGEPSKWLTFYGMRALQQWDTATTS